RARAACPVQARPPPGVRRVAEDDQRKDPPGRAARPRGARERARVPRGGSGRAPSDRSAGAVRVVEASRRYAHPMDEIIQLMSPNGQFARFADGARTLLAWALIRSEGQVPLTRVEGLILSEGAVVVASAIDGFEGYGQPQHVI